MFTKEYKRALSREWSLMISRQLDIPEKMHEIFVLGPRVPRDIWGASNNEAYNELHNQDILVQNVEMMLLTDCRSMTLSFSFKVTVNSSFMPEQTDELCQAYFEKRWKHIRDEFGNVTDDMALEIAHEIERQYLGMPVSNDFVL